MPLLPWLVSTRRISKEVCQYGKMKGMTTDFSTMLDAVGPRLRAMRTQRNVTLAEASEGTGISVSTLSRLESGQRKPTLELLLPIARLHQVPLEELIDAPETGDPPRIHLKPHVHEWGTALPLTRRPPGGIQAFKMVLKSGTGKEIPQPQSHEGGYDWMYILNGKLRWCWARMTLS